MYLFVFLWVPSLQEAAATNTVLPLGYIFSCFMLSMMLGSLLYTAIISISGDSSVTQHAKLSSFVCAVSAFALTVSVTSEDEHVRFWAFCAFESCVGMYYPVQGMLRGSLIADEHRATVRILCPSIASKMFILFSAILVIPSSTQHLCGCFSPYWCLFCTARSDGLLCSHALHLFNYDWCCHREPSRKPRGPI